MIWFIIVLCGVLTAVKEPCIGFQININIKIDKAIMNKNR
jgi:hypothetical protein